MYQTDLLALLIMVIEKAHEHLYNIELVFVGFNVKYILQK